MPAQGSSSRRSNLSPSVASYPQTYYTLPSESPPSPSATSPAPPAAAIASPKPKKKGKQVPRKLNATGTIKSDSLDPSPGFKYPVAKPKEIPSPEKKKPDDSGFWCSCKLLFSSKDRTRSDSDKAQKPEKVKEPSIRKNSSGSDSSDNSDSSDYSEKDSYSPTANKGSKSDIPAVSKSSTMGSSNGYFAQGNSPYSSNAGFEQFPASTGGNFSPSESDESDSPPQQKGWFSGLFKPKEKVPEAKETYSSPYGVMGPPSPPTSVMSTSTVGTIRHNVNQSTASLSSAPTQYPTTTYNRAYGDAGGTSSAPAGNNGSSNTWAFWSRMKNGEKSDNAISEDGVVAFTGPSAQSFIQKQRQSSRMDDNASIMSSDTVLVNPGPPKMSRNGSRMSLSTSNYPPSMYNNSTPNLSFDPNSYGTPQKLGRADTIKSLREDAKSIRTVRNIDSLAKPVKEVPAINTVKSASGAKETALMAPPPTNLPSDSIRSEPTPTKKSKKAKDQNQIRYPNMVVPKLEDCMTHTSSGTMFWSSVSRVNAWLRGSKEDRLQVQLTSPAKIRKAVAIGIHGFFPIRMVRSIIGEPTGTSVKFANEAALGIKRWADAHGQEVEIEKIALEGEGIVLDRVENLYRLLSNWMDHLHEADFILVAAHSQGTPVAIQLVAKLIEEGHADNKKIGIVGMAGVSLGPFYGLDQKLVMRAYTSFESDSLKELFAFQNPESLQARRYIQGIRTVIEHGVKISFIGSVNDQLVPLYSSLCVHVNHPHIYRAVYVDGKAHSPSFIIYLVELLTKLRNLGLSDHGIIRDVSDSLAGTLTGGGHSNIYNEHAVYDVAIKYALETTDIPGLPVRVDKFEVPMPSNYNPYHLPWSLRGIFEQDFVRKHLLEDVKKTLDKFDEWMPESKPLKDIKYRLGAIKATATGAPPPVDPQTIAA